MTLFRKFLLAGSAALALVLAGGIYYGQYCVRHMSADYSGPAAAQAAKQKFTCSMHPFIIEDHPGDCPICGMSLTPVKADPGVQTSPGRTPPGQPAPDLTPSGGQTPQGQAPPPNKGRKIKYWVAPMDPTYIRDKPGKSPMGMDLVPVYEDEAASGSVIRIDPVTMQNMGVQTEPVRRETLTKEIRAVGLVTYKEPQQYVVNSKISGWVERLYVNETGQFVKKGEPLLEIYSPDLVSAQQEYLLALKNEKALKDSPFPAIAESGQSLLEATRNRLKYWDISDHQIKELEKSGTVRKNLVLYAPYNGIVTRKQVDEGMYVKAGMGLLQISDISSVWVDAQVYEYELPWLKPHQRARVDLPYAPQEASLNGEVSYIYPYVDSKTRTTRVRLDFANPGYRLKPDMYVNVQLAARTIPDAMVIPTNAILDSGDKQTVFVALGNGRFEPRRIKVGLQGEGGKTQVLQGLLAGDRVVTSAQFMLDSESQLKEAIQKMLEPPKEPAVEAGQGQKKKAEDLNSLF